MLKFKEFCDKIKKMVSIKVRNVEIIRRVTESDHELEKGQLVMIIGRANKGNPVQTGIREVKVGVFDHTEPGCGRPRGDRLFLRPAYRLRKCDSEGPVLPVEVTYNWGEFFPFHQGCIQEMYEGREKVLETLNSMPDFRKYADFVRQINGK